MQNNKLPTNRSFGMLFFIVFLIISLWPLINKEEIRLWTLVISFIFFILGILQSKLLTPLNKLWMKFGFFLGKIISPLVMGIIFFGVVTPTGFIMKIFKKDTLKLKKSYKKSFWILKDNSKNNMENQF